MGKRIIITEEQFKRIGGYLNETMANVRLRNMIHSFLEADYEPSGGVERLANEFYKKPLIMKKIDGEYITPKALYDYMLHKFVGIDKNIIKDCLKGWYKGDYDRSIGMRKKNK